MTLSSIPQPDISYVIDAATSITSVLRSGNLVLLESTSPVGTTELVSQKLEQISGLTSDQFHVAYCPERVLPGRILEELITNDRVIGGLTPCSSQAGIDFYATFCQGELLAQFSYCKLVKLTENSFRDVNIAFANELSLVCDYLDINVRELIRLANHHPRVNVLQPGCGVGGHCIAVDPWFIAAAASHCTPLIQAARRVNDSKSSWVIEQVQSRAADLQHRLGRPVRIGCLGLTFKPDVDDLRESPALHITTQLVLSDLHVLACEPNQSLIPRSCCTPCSRFLRTPTCWFFWCPIVPLEVLIFADVRYLILVVLLSRCEIAVLVTDQQKAWLAQLSSCGFAPFCCVQWALSAFAPGNNMSHPRGAGGQYPSI